MWGEITYPFPNFNGVAIEVWEWISNFISHLIGLVITYPHFMKRKQGKFFHWRKCISKCHLQNHSHFCSSLKVLTQWGRVMHMCISKLIINGSDNGMSPGWCHAIIVRRAGLLWSQQDFEWRWSVPLFKCLTVLEFSFILFDLCLLITFFNFIMNYVPIVTFWIFTYHKIWILSIMFCSIWSYWIIYFLACLEVSWRVVS